MTSSVAKAARRSIWAWCTDPRERCVWLGVRPFAQLAKARPVLTLQRLLTHHVLPADEGEMTAVPVCVRS